MRSRSPLLVSVALVLLPSCATRSPSGEGGGPPDDEGPGDPEVAAACDPAPITRASDLAPDLYAWIMAAEEGSCHLDRRTSAGTVDGFPTTLDTFPAPGTVACDAEGCWTALPAFSRAWIHVPPPRAFTPSAGYPGEMWTGMVGAARNADTGEVRATLTAMHYGSSALFRFERRFDAAGHLVEERQSFDAGLWFTTINTWEGEHLLASRFVDTVNGTGETRYAWAWRDDGRLAGATVTHVDSGRVGKVELAYEGEHLVSVTRTIDGAVWARQSWTWADERVTESSTEIDPALANVAAEVDGADDLEPLLGASSQLEWSAARPEPRAGAACTALPHAFGYGYPVADGLYHLGWPVGDRPSGIDADYGFGPAYDSGMDRWFGHDGVEYYSWQLPFTAPTVRAAVAYDDQGRMTSETLATSDGALSAVRTRRFEHGRVTADTRVLERGGETLTTELAFRHDEGGNLVERSYTMNGVLVGRHSWSYDGGEITRHTIGEHRLPWPSWDDAGVVPEGLETLGDLPAPVVHERTFAAAGTRIEIRRDGELVEMRTRDQAGRILSRSYPPSGSLETYAYEPSGELRSFSSDYDVDGTPDLLMAWERADDGRLLARDWAYTSRSDHDSFTWVCE